MSSKCRSLYIDRGLSESSNYCDIDRLDRRNKTHKTSLHVLAPCKGRVLLEFSVQQASLKVQISQAEFPKTNLRDTMEPHLRIHFTLSNVEKHLVPYVKLVSTAPDFTLRYDSCCLFHNLSMDQRIIISSYVKDENDKIEIIGMMSFGIRKLWESDLLSGWYYLLKENIGHKKHLKVYQETIPRSVTANALCKADTDIGSEILNLELFRKGDEFGFTICGNQPAYVGKVENDSPAHKAGLQPCDVIVKISHLLVFSCSAKAIAQILRLYPDSVNITIFRTKKSDVENLKAIEEKDGSTSAKTKSTSKSWFKKMISPRKNSSSYDISETNFYVSNLRYCTKSDDKNPSEQSQSNKPTEKGHRPEKASITDRLQYLGHIQAVNFSKNNNRLEYESMAWLIEPSNYILVTVLLFPQLIIITQKEPDGFYTVIKPPIRTDSISYLSIPADSKYDLVLQYINPFGVKEFLHLQCESCERLVNLIKEKRHCVENELITVK